MRTYTIAAVFAAVAFADGHPEGEKKEGEEEMSREEQLKSAADMIDLFCANMEDERIEAKKHVPSDEGRRL